MKIEIDFFNSATFIQRRRQDRDEKKQIGACVIFIILNFSQAE